MNLKKENSDLSFSWESSVSDIAFLLIIFFILTASFGLNRIIKFQNQTAQTKTVNPKDIVNIRVKENNTLLYNNKNITTEELSIKLSKNKNYILKVDDSVKYKKFISTIDIFQEKNITTFELGE